MVSIKQTKMRNFKSLRQKMLEEGRLKSVSAPKNKKMTLSLRMGLLKMGFDVILENTNSAS